MMFIFYISMPVLLLTGYFLSRKGTALGYYLFSSFGLILFVLSIMAVISFITPYIYESPTLHCPFCMMRKEYDYVGYLLYFLLFGAFFLSLVPGLMEFLKRKGGQIEYVVGDLQRKTLKLSMILWGFFVLMPSLIIILYEIRMGGAHLFA